MSVQPIARRIADSIRTFRDRVSVVAPLLACVVLVLASTPGQINAQAQANPDPSVVSSQIRALLGMQEDAVLPEQWRSLGALAAPILKSIAADQTALPTRRARSIEGLTALGSVDGPALFSQLAASEQEPLIVRMSAARGLGAVLRQPQRLAQLTPLLQALDPQLRGVAAEVLSQDAAGCTAIAQPAKRESVAWRARFVQACSGLESAQDQGINAQHASGNLDDEDGGDANVRTVRLGSFTVFTTQLSSPIYVDVPEDAVSMDLVGVATDPTARVVVYQIVDPSGTTVWSYASNNNILKIFPPPEPGSFSVVLPNSPTPRFTPGRWTFYLLGARATTANVEALIKTSSDNRLSAGTLDLNLFFVGVPGLNAASARTDPSFQALISDVERIYRRIGLLLGRVTFIDITGPDATRFADATGDIGPLLELSSNPRAHKRAANVFLVHSIDAGPGGFVILGQSGGIPGTPVNGTAASGVAVTMADFPMGLDSLAETIGHETGHWLGLFHTTEAQGAAFDPLPDTPECSRVPFDTNNDGLVEPLECLTRDATNLMFWAGDPSIPQTTLTPNQQFVLLRNPIVRQGDPRN